MKIFEASHNLNSQNKKSSTFNNSNFTTSNMMNSDKSGNWNINSIYYKQNQSSRHQPLKYLDEQSGNGNIQNTFNSFRGRFLVQNQINKGKSQPKIHTISKLKLNYYKS